MNTWSEINFLDFSLKTRFVLIILFTIINIILYILFRKSDINNKFIHKIISIINIFMELFIMVICLYKFHVLYIILAPLIIIFITAIGYGINKELSDEDKSILVVRRGFKLSTKFKSKFVELVYFPGYYLMESWRKNK
jgi:hypothetical protein